MLIHDIIKTILQNEEIHIVFPNLNINISQLVESKCYSALHDTKNILNNKALSDKECFHQIEEIIRIFEKLNTPCSRHDFG